MLTKKIILKNYKTKNTNKKKLKKILSKIINEQNILLSSFGKNYKDNYKKETVLKYKKSNNFRIIGMGGSSLGTQSIFKFLKHKIKKNFIFLDNLVPNNDKLSKKSHVNIIVSKSGNTTETIVNSNIILKNKDKNIFITENKKSYLFDLAKSLKAEIIHHNNFIGGRYSVLSEVGMLPAELMGLDPVKFRQLNNLIKNRNFLNSLVSNVSSTLFFLNQKKFNSVIINYDSESDSLFKWYQQLIAESLGKQNNGILPIVSTMPRDNHSVMQLYLDGFKNNFFTIFYVRDPKSDRINNKTILSSKNYLRNKSVAEILYAKKKATENVFLKKKIPFRSFEIKIRDEKTLGELFCFFMLETILLGKYLEINPFDQPAVELIKKKTEFILK